MPEDNFEQKIIEILEKTKSWPNVEFYAGQIFKAIDQEIENRLRKIGVGIANCKKCNEEIIFIKTKGGNLMPVRLNLISHFADCPGADEFRKGRTITNPLTNKTMDKEEIKNKLKTIRTLTDEIEEELGKEEGSESEGE